MPKWTVNFPYLSGLCRKEMKQYLDCSDYSSQIRVGLVLFLISRPSAFGVSVPHERLNATLASIVIFSCSKVWIEVTNEAAPVGPQVAQVPKPALHDATRRAQLVEMTTEIFNLSKDVDRHICQLAHEMDTTCGRITWNQILRE